MSPIGQDTSKKGYLEAAARLEKGKASPADITMLRRMQNAPRFGDATAQTVRDALEDHDADQ